MPLLIILIILLSIYIIKSENIKTAIKKDIEKIIPNNQHQHDKAQGEQHYNYNREISRKNPWILTEDFQRIRFLEKYYGEVDIKDLGELFKNQSISMSVNPKEVKDFIDKLTEEGKSKEEVRNILFNDFEKYFKL